MPAQVVAHQAAVRISGQRPGGATAAAARQMRANSWMAGCIKVVSQTQYGSGSTSAERVHLPSSPVQQRGGGDGGGMHAAQRLGEGKVHGACDNREERRQ